jgi:hypothetical protein
MKPIHAITIAAAVILSGCARFTTRQTDESWTTEDGGTYRIVVTHATTTCFFDSQSRLARFRAVQTEKSQSASVGDIESAASGTNAVRVVEAVGKGVVEGLKVSAGIP